MMAFLLPRDISMRVAHPLISLAWTLRQGACLPLSQRHTPCCVVLDQGPIQHSPVDDGQRAGHRPTLAGTSARGRIWRGTVTRYGLRGWAFVFLIVLTTSAHAQLRAPVN